MPLSFQALRIRRSFCCGRNIRGRWKRNHHRWPRRRQLRWRAIRGTTLHRYLFHRRGSTGHHGHRKFCRRNCGCAPTQFTFKFNVVSDQPGSLHRVRRRRRRQGYDREARCRSVLVGSYRWSIRILAGWPGFQQPTLDSGPVSRQHLWCALGRLSLTSITDQTISTCAGHQGALTLGVNGRGTATLTTPVGELHFAYYVVSN